MLEVPQSADGDQIKNAYHALARRYHPDRFHQTAPEFRARVESAFARIAQAYEVLSRPRSRSDYDKQQGKKAKPTAGEPARQEQPSAQLSRAENSFRRGLQALEARQMDEAVRLFSECAMLEPREARYRAHYG